MKIIKRLFILLVVFFLVSASLILLREPVLDFIVTRIKIKVKEKYGATLSIASSDFSGIRDLVLSNISLIPANGDTLLSVHQLKAKISISKLLRLKVRLRELVVDTGKIQLIKQDSSDNYSFFLRRKKEADPDSLLTVSDHGYKDRFLSIAEKVNELFDERITIGQFRFIYKTKEVEEMVQIPELYFDGYEFKSSVITSSKDGVNLWLMNGVADPDINAYNFSVKKVRGDAFALPFVDLFDGFKVCFDSAQIDLKTTEEKGLIKVKSNFKMYNFLANHWRIAPVDVRVPQFRFNLNAFVAEDSIGLGNLSVFTLNELSLPIAVSYVRKPERRIRLNAGFKTEDAQTFFDALPEGMFYTLKGFKASGTLDYKLQFDLPLENPQQLLFSSRMNSTKLKIESYGSENFSKIGLPFNFLAMDRDRPVRSFEVGPGNPYFTPLEFISPYLRDAVLTAEDPSFMNHGGFVEEAFRESIVTNIREKRFARGGSTISMQLVKNIFLSRNKSVSRKLEEILIVWLMEHNRLVSKERMLEVYLNIIEWGPDVYGIGEASRFYFSKSPDELTLGESIFLSSLIPSPKYFKYRFDINGQLKPYMANYFKLIGSRLSLREKIQQWESDSLKAEVHLKGPALNYVLPVDSLPPDTLPLLPDISQEFLH